MQDMDLVIEVTPGRASSICNRRFNFGLKKSRSHLFGTITVLLGIIVLLVVLLQIIFNSQSKSRLESEIKNVSRQHEENLVHIHIDNVELDPCNDFYKFACQNWQEKNKKTERQNRWTVFAVQYYKINKLAIDILEEPIQDEEIDVMTQAKNLYRKCLTENTRLQSILRGTFGQTSYPAINELCMDSLKNIYNTALAHKIAVVKYRETKQLEDIRNEVQEMFENMRNWLRQINNHSLPNSIEQTKLCIGLPDWIFNQTKVQGEYNELHLDTNETFSQQLDAATHWLRQTSAEQKSNNKSECPWADSMGYDGAYYLKSKNLIYVPLGLLEPPYFSPNQSESQNYGTLGSILGHELAHAYLVPNANNIDNSTLSCLQSQYHSLGGHELKSRNVPLGLDLTIHENLADNLGLLAAYNVRFRTSQVRDSNNDYDFDPNWTRKSHAGQFNDEQLFFLSFAQKWCEVPSSNVLVNEHSSSKLRVLGTLQNSNEFAHAWSCPIGSPMNPSPRQHKKCQFVSKL